MHQSSQRASKTCFSHRGQLKELERNHQLEGIERELFAKGTKKSDEEKNLQVDIRNCRCTGLEKKLQVRCQKTGEWQTTFIRSCKIKVQAIFLVSLSGLPKQKKPLTNKNLNSQLGIARILLTWGLNVYPIFPYLECVADSFGRLEAPSCMAQPACQIASHATNCHVTMIKSHQLLSHTLAIMHSLIDCYNIISNFQIFYF